MKLLPWQQFQVDNAGHKEMHLVPLNDIEHHKLCEHCACQPDEDPVAPDMWNHNAYDQREKHELGAKLH